MGFKIDLNINNRWRWVLCLKKERILKTLKIMPNTRNLWNFFHNIPLKEKV